MQRAGRFVGSLHSGYLRYFCSIADRDGHQAIVSYQYLSKNIDTEHAANVVFLQ